MPVEAGKPGGPTLTQDYEVLKAIEAVERESPLAQDWRTVQGDVMSRLRRTCPSVLAAFNIGFCLKPGILDDHLAPVYTPRSAVDRLADLPDA